MVPHIIVTRLGVGVRNPEFYRVHLEYLKRSVARSLAAQTERNFTWAVVIDERAPEWVEPELAALNLPQLVVWKIDPIRHGMNPAPRHRVKEIVSEGPVIVSRVDDDDFLHVEFVERAGRELGALGPLSAYTVQNGANLYPDGSTGSMRYAWFSAGLAILTTVEDFVSPYALAHNRADALIERRGGRVFVDEADRPGWVRSLHGDSDSGEAHGLDRWSKTQIELPWADYGTTADEVRKLSEVLAQAKPAPEMRMNGFGKPYSRLGLKSNILTEIKRIRQQEDDPERKAARINVLAQAFYLI